jgi:hypothetical protein
MRPSAIRPASRCKPTPGPNPATSTSSPGPGGLGGRFLLRDAVGSRHNHGGDHADRPAEEAWRCDAGSLADPARFMPRRRAFQIPVTSHGSAVLVALFAVIAGNRLYRQPAYFFRGYIPAE